MAITFRREEERDYRAVEELVRNRSGTSTVPVVWSTMC